MSIFFVYAFVAMADSDSFNVSINKFSGTNYPQWKFQISCALKAKGLWKIAVGEEIKPHSTSTNSGEIEKFNQKDAKAMFVITSAMDLNQISLIENCECSKEIFTKLDSIFQQKSDFTKMMLLDQFHQIKMDPSDTVVQHISKIENLAKQIKNTGETLTDATIITKIIGTLPIKYKTFRQAWLSLEENKQTITNLTARLLDEEASLTNIESTEKAFIVKRNKNRGNNYLGHDQRNYQHSYRNPVRNNNNNNRLSQNSQQFKRNQINPHFSSNNDRNFHHNGQQSNYFKRSCYQCGSRDGHLAKDCPQNAHKNKNYDRTKPTAFTTSISAHDRHENNNTWILDSGASTHMTYIRDFLTNYCESQNSEEFVQLGDNSTLQVKGKGTVHINAFANNNWKKCTIENVLYVPELKKNLFSESVITKKGFKIVKENKTAEIFDENNYLVALAILKSNNLYEMKMTTVIHHDANQANNSKNILKLWHERLGHINLNSMKELNKKNLIPDWSKESEENFFCEGCQYGKQHKFSFNERKNKETLPGTVIYSDICGPFSQPSIGGARYFILFKDSYTGYRQVKFLTHKSDALHFFKDYVNLCKQKFGHTVKTLHVDNGSEYSNNDFQNYLSKNGITMETTAPYTPEQNSRAERDMRTIVECARTMIYSKNLPLHLWAEAVNTATYILNRTPTTQTPGSSPYELWTNKQPTLQHLRIFGSEAYMHIPDQLRKKLDPKSRKMIFVGYDSDSTNYRLFNPISKKIQISRNVVFNENQNLITNSEESEIEIPLEEENYDFELDSVQDINHQYNLRPRSEIKAPIRHRVNLAQLVVPETYNEALNSPQAAEWNEAIQEELDALHKNNTWKLCDLPQDKSCVGSKWVFKIKYLSNGDVERFKARLCAKGYSQTEGTDFNETFAPTARYDTLRILFSIAAQKNLKMKQFDIKTAFLYGTLEEEVYMEAPEGLENPDNKVCRLYKSLYGLKQSSRCWNRHFTEVLNSFGFKQGEADKCVFHATIMEHLVILVCYVDDGIIMSSSETVLCEVIKNLKLHFEATVGDVHQFIGMEIKLKGDGSLYLHSYGYIQRLLRRFNFEDIKPSSVPADPSTVLSKQSIPINEKVPYREAIGSLIFLAITTRPDIMFAVSLVSRFQENPGQSHWNAVKRIFKYLKQTQDLGITYSSDPNDFNLIGFSDSDYAGDVDCRKSTSGYIFKIAGGAVSWASRLQSTVSTSTTEAEYVAASAAVKEAIWLKQLLCDINMFQSVCKSESVPLFIDNQSAIKLIKNPVLHKRTKHIDICFHFVREKYENKEISVSYVATENQLADIFTKPLPKQRFEKCRYLIMNE